MPSLKGTSGATKKNKTAKKETTNKEVSPASSAVPPDSPDTLRRRRIISIVSLVILIAVFALAGYFVGRPLVKTFGEPKTFRAWVDARGIWGQIAMIGISMLQVVVALIPGEPFEVAAGYAFGAFEGTILCLVGFAIASSLIFLVVKRFGMKIVEAFFSREQIDKISFLKDAKRLDMLVFILFLIPGTPKDVLTYFVGVTPMTLGRFLLITMVARIPSVLSSTLSGSMLGSEKYALAAVTYGVTILISAVCVVWYRKVSKENRLKQQEEAQKNDQGGEENRGN